MAKKQFKAESKRLLDLMINSIYTNKEIFLREIISNASDALDKLHYVSLTDQKARDVIDGKPLEIHITADKENRTLTVSDNGIGMSEAELETNLGTICKSGSLAFKDNIADNEEDVANIIGQFGVGFYSAFMVAESVTVRSKRYDSDTAYQWTSVGADGYTVTECDKQTVGTDVIMKIKADTEDEHFGDYLETYRIKNLIKTYSDYIRYPIMTEVEKTKTVGEGENAKTEKYFETETLNSMTPIWKRGKNEVTDEECNKFYKDTFFDAEEPIATIRVSTEGLVSYKALLFIPASAPYNYFTKDYKKGLKLYANGVLIMDNCEDLLPEHFRFVRGVVDSDDLSLNISREMLQQDKQLKTIASSIEKKIKSELEKMLKNDREKYEKFFAVFGLQLKYGVASDFGMHKDMIKDLLLFYSANQQKLVTVKEYLELKPEDQKHIYYACGETVKKIMALPQVELLKAKGYDMLCLTDEADEFVVKMLNEPDKPDFMSINDENADLGDGDNDKNIEKTAEENKEMLSFLKEKLNISDVVISKKLKSHAVCLSAVGGVTLEMEKYFARMPMDTDKPKAERVLELNPDHKAFAALKQAYSTDKDKAAKLGEILYDQALLIADLPVDDPARMSDLICELF